MAIAIRREKVDLKEELEKNFLPKLRQATSLRSLENMLDSKVEYEQLELGEALTKLVKEGELAIGIDVREHCVLFLLP